MYGHEYDERGGRLRITRTDPKAEDDLRPQAKSPFYNAKIQSPTHISTLDFDDEDMVMSTRPNVDDDLRRGRFPPGRFSSDESDQQSEASSARQHSDNDCHILPEDDSLEIEVARGGLPRSARPTPSKLRQAIGTSDILLDMGNSSLYEVTATPPLRSKSTRKSNGLDSGNLRRDAQLRRASGRQHDGSTMDLTSNKRHERHSSLPQNLVNDQSPRVGGNTVGANATASSDFEIPQVNNMTELFAPDTQEQQMVSSSNRSRSKQLLAKRRSQAQDYMSIHGVPLPQDEQLIINGLEELRMKLSR